MKSIKFLSLFMAITVCCTALLFGCNKKVEENEEAKAKKNEKKTQTEQSDVIDISKIECDVFENKAFALAVSQCLGIDVEELTEKHLEDIRYIAIGPEEDGSVTVFVGLDDYITEYFSEDVTIESLSEYVKTSVLLDTDVKSSDLGKFKYINVFELYNIKIDDVSFIKNYENLFFGYFNNNGITDVSSLADYNPDNLYELDFTGNDIEDWSYLKHIDNKVIVNYSVTDMTDADGNVVQVPFVTKLSDIGESTEQTGDESDSETEVSAEQVPETSDDTQPESQLPQQSAEKPEIEFEYSDDWSVLFE